MFDCANVGKKKRILALALTAVLSFSRIPLFSHCDHAFSFAAPKVVTSNSATQLFEGPPTVERGVSIDQDGKSNVWAIEPREELETKSSEEKMTGVIIGGAAFAAFAVGAGFVLTNLPDPNSF